MAPSLPEKAVVAVGGGAKPAGEGGGCGGAQGAGEAGDGCGQKDPAASLEQALAEFENAKCPKKKRKALEEMRKAYEEIEKKGIEIDPQLKQRAQIIISLDGGLNDDGMFRSPGPGQQGNQGGALNVNFGGAGKARSGRPF